MDAPAYFRFVLALVLVLGLIMALAWGMRRLGFGNGPRGLLTRRKRLRVIEAATVDVRHKIVLVRRDDVEHLILVGPNSSQVIERGIPAAADEPPPDSAVRGTSFRQLLGRDAQS